MYVKDVIERFGIKHADFASLAPAVVLPALGQYIGKRLGGDPGQLIGGITGGLSGQLLREQLAQRQRAPEPAPQQVQYVIDPTTEDIPAWALQGAHVLKQAGWLDYVLGEVPGALPVQRAYQGYKQHGLLHGLGQGAKAFGGMTLGGVPGALLGMGVGKGIEHLTGHKGGLNVPLINIKLHELLGGLGGTIGAVKGLQALTGEGH